MRFSTYCATTFMPKCWEANVVSKGEAESRHTRFFLGILPFAGIGLGWLILVHLLGVRPVFLPPLEDMPGTIWGMFQEQGIASDISISCMRVFAAFVIAVIMATPLGVLMGYSLRANQIFEPIIGFI